MSKILVFASGTKNAGGSGFLEMVEQSKTKPEILKAEIAGVVSSYPKGGVYKIAKKYSIPFEYWPGPYDKAGYQNLVKKYKADFVMCSGWLKFVRGLEPAKTLNIHPALLPNFGGPGMYGHFVHQAAIKAHKNGEIKESGFTIHFVDEIAYDHGPIIFKYPVLIRDTDNAETLASRINEKERAWQSFVLNLVVQGEIKLEDGKVIFSKEAEKIIGGR